MGWKKKKRFSIITAIGLCSDLLRDLIRVLNAHQGCEMVVLFGGLTDGCSGAAVIFLSTHISPSDF